jgi:transcriptional regulator with XRE-family HTH domain
VLITGYQLAAARALIGMEQAELASLSGLSLGTIRNMEAAKAKDIAARHESIRTAQRSLESAGIEFLDDDRPGVRMKKPRLNPETPKT